MSVSSSDNDPWSDAVRVAAIFAVDPVGLAGVSVKAPAGWVRDKWLSILRALLPENAPFRRIPLHISDNRLLGGLDLAATLHAGRPIAEHGILSEAAGGVVVLAMAERVSAFTVAQLAACLDTGEVRLERDGLGLCLPSRFGVVAFDESREDDERPSATLLDRLAFQIDLTTTGMRDTADSAKTRQDIDEARTRSGQIEADASIVEAMCATAIALGIASMRPPLLALHAARTLAALAGRSVIGPEDAALAARLVLAPRATQMPAAAQEEMAAAGEAADAPAETRSDQSPQHEQSDIKSDNQEIPLDDIVLAAAQAAIPDALLAKLRLGKASRAGSTTSGRAGMIQQTVRRGRPIGVRKGEPRSGARLSIIETLRAAVPWQRLRRESLAAGRNLALLSQDVRRIEIRRDDFRVARLKQRSETTTIFVVDASGSSALNRLAEAKGAVELLLAECYVRRDRVALIAFRGKNAELLLPPTRSLIRAKRCLAALPGGGGTPLAAGIDAASALADTVSRQGSTPVIVVMTDGRANIGRDGKPGRPQAEAEAFSAARSVRHASFTALLVDTSPKAQPSATRLALEMGAVYLPLPYADATMLSKSVGAAARIGSNRMGAQ